MRRPRFGLKANALYMVITAFLAVGLVVALWLSIGWSSRALPAAAPTQDAREEATALPALKLQISTPMTMYLPLLQHNYPPPPAIFGTQMKAIKDSHGLPYAVEAGIHWVRFSAFAWDEIEPVRTEPPTYHWEVVKEQSLSNAAANGLEVIAIIRFTPPWAQKYPDSYCGPIQEEALDEFAEFLTALVARYSAPPYNVRYWELGNEPDIPIWYNRSVYGCWGEEDDPYYGGEYYAEMLKMAYPAIKAADPRAQVLIGGLLLDCDPTDPPSGKDCKPAKFLEGILENQGGPCFDIVSYHGYPPYVGSLERDEHFLGWESRGGVVLGKADFLREVMADYGYYKPIMHTEGSLICPEWQPDLCDPPGAAFYEAQADYVVWLFVRNWAADMLGTVWYQFEGPGWRYSGLLDENQNPKPAYHALDFLAEELEHASYQGTVTQFAALRGYEFSDPGKRVWVLWAPDEEPQDISLPADVTRVYDKYGNDITPAGDTVTVSSPIYLELSP